MAELSAREKRILRQRQANDLRIAALQAELRPAESLRQSGIDPVTLRNLPRYRHEITMLATASGRRFQETVTKPVDVSVLVRKWGKHA